MRNSFRYGFESFSDRFYFRLKYVYRQLKKIFFTLIGFTFQTLNFFEILPNLIKFSFIFFLLVIFYDITLNLPLYILYFNVSNFTITFCSGYLSVYENVLLFTSNYFFYCINDKYNCYFFVLLVLGVWNIFDLNLRLKYEWLVFKKLTTCLSFEEYRYIESSIFNFTQPVKQTLTNDTSFFKKIYLVTKYIFLFRNYLKLFINYLLIIVKKFYLHFFSFICKNFFSFCRNYFSQFSFFISVKWRPIFKKWSYFGLFRSYRSKWINKN